MRENTETRVERHRNQDYSHNEQIDIAYRLFFHYMQRFPKYGEFLLAEFFGKYKPILDGIEDKADRPVPGPDESV